MFQRPAVWTAAPNDRRTAFDCQRDWIFFEPEGTHHPLMQPEIRQHPLRHHARTDNLYNQSFFLNRQ